MPKLDPPLTLKPATAFYILLKAREFDAKVERPDGGEDASNPSDDRAVDVLVFRGDDPEEQELFAAIRPLNEDERLDLIALIWIGRGDFGFDDWPEAREAARRIPRSHAPRYIREIPLASDYLEGALSELGFRLSDYLDSGFQRPGGSNFGEATA